MARSSTTVTKGNKLALKHGGYSLQPLPTMPAAVQKVYDALYAGNPQLTPADCFLIEGIARKATILANMYATIWDLGGNLIDSRGRIRAGAPLLVSFERLMNKELNDAGLTPLSRGKLMGDLAGAKQAMAAVRAQDELSARYVTPGGGRSTPFAETSETLPPAEDGPSDNAEG